jgi:hypothetical protein
MKYIVFENQKTKWVNAVIFDDTLTHSQVTVEGARPISAGFVDPRSGKVSGRSETLNLSANQDDEMLVGATLISATHLVHEVNLERIDFIRKETRH